MAFMASTMLTFSPRQLFGAGEQGVWYDPADLSSLWQDAQGTTAVTAVEQAVGLILDRREGRGLGTELVTNNTFATDTTWTKGTGWSIGSGVATKTAGSASVLSQAVSLTAGHTYRLVYTITRSAGSITPQFTGGSTVAGTARSAAGTFVEVLTAVSGNTTLEFSADASFAGTVDNVYLKRVSGNDAWQLTSASRPVLSARYNLLTYSEEFDNAAWTLTNLLAFGSGSTVNAAVAPDGTTTAELITENTANGEHNIGQIATVGSGSVVTFSVCLKKPSSNGRQYVSVYLSDRIAKNYAILVDLDAGTISNYTGIGFYAAPTSSSITALGSGWYRCTLTANLDAGRNSVSVNVSLRNSGSAASALAYTGDGASGTLVWGASLTATAASVSVPTYQRITSATSYATAGFPLYLRFDGVDDALQVGSAVDVISAATTVNSWVAARGIAPTTENDAGPYLSIGTSTKLHVLAAFTSSSMVIYTNGVDASRNATITAVDVQEEHVSFHNLVIGQKIEFRFNGSARAVTQSTSLDQRTGANGLNIGRREISSFFSGNLYGVILRGAASSTGYIRDTEQWLASRMLRTL